MLASDRTAAAAMIPWVAPDPVGVIERGRSDEEEEAEDDDEWARSRRSIFDARRRIATTSTDCRLEAPVGVVGDASGSASGRARTACVADGTVVHSRLGAPQ